jgi:GDPmannose 4,6-dehydratase
VGGDKGRRVALVTGVTGQDGIYLSHLLLARGYRVVGTTTRSSVGLLPYLDGIELVTADVRDSEAMSALLRRVRPDELYNLAALSSVGASWQAAEQVAEVNGMAVLRLLETLVRLRDELGWTPRFYQASSSEIFGLAEHQPQNEWTPHRPRSPYGTAKSFAHHLTINYRESYGLFACSGVLFNHESPLRPTRFVTRKISRAVAEISLGLRTTVTLGNLDARRDWGSAADYVEAMWSMLQQETARDYVIATGSTASIRDFADLAFAVVGIDDPARYVEQDPAFMRPADVPQTWGDPARAVADLGWQARTALPALVQHMVATDVLRLRSGVEESPEYLFLPPSPRSTDA